MLFGFCQKATTFLKLFQLSCSGVFYTSSVQSCAPEDRRNNFWHVRML